MGVLTSRMLWRLEDIGGGRVMRGFRRGDEWVRAGTPMTGAELRAMPITNLRCMVEGHVIEVWPRDLSGLPPDVDQVQRHVVSAGFGKFHVYEGTRLTEQPLTKAEAEALAGRTVQ